MSDPIVEVLDKDQFIERLKEGGVYELWGKAGYMKYLDETSDDQQGKSSDSVAASFNKDSRIL